MADAAAAAAKRKKIIEDAKQRAKKMRPNTIFNFGLPSTKSNGPLPQSSFKKTTGPSPAAIQKNNRSMTQRLRNSLFGRSAAPAPVASAPAPLAAAPVAAPVAAPAPADNAPVAPPLLNVKTRRKARSQIPNVNAARKFIKEYNNIPNEQKKDLDAINHEKYRISKKKVYQDEIPYIIHRKLNDDDPIKNKEGIKIFTDLIEEYQEISLFKGPNDKIQGLYTDLNKKILEIIPERKKLDQLKKDRKISIDSTTQTTSEKAETIRKYNELRNSLFNKHRYIMTLINGIDLHIKTCEVKKRLINQYQELDFFIDYNVFTVREPIFLKNIREYIEYLEEPIEDLEMNTRSTLLYMMIDDVNEEKSTIILNEIAIKSTNNDFYDDSDSIRQEMKEAIDLFTDNFLFLKELKKIRDTRNKMYAMNESLELKGLNYSYRKSRNRGPETTVEEHKNKITEVLRSKIEKNKNDIDKRKYTDEDIQFFLERRGEYNDTEEMAYIENILLTSNFRDLLKMANYINKNQIRMYINDIDYVKLSTDDSYYSKKSNEAFYTVIKMYYQEKNKSLDDKMFIRRSFIDKWIKLLNQKKNSNNIRNEDYKEVIKSIIKDNKFTTPYRLTKFLLAIPQIQKEGIQKNFIQRIYNSIEQEDMDKVIKEKKVKNEIDTNEKAMAFAKEYLSKTDEPTEDDRYRFDKSFELLRKDKLWPINIEEAKTFIEKYKGINETDPKYFILKKAEGIIQKGKETAAKEFSALPLNNQLNRLNTRSPEKKSGDKLAIKALQEKEVADAKAEAEAAAKAASEAPAKAASMAEAPGAPPYPRTKNNADQADDDRCLLSSDKRPNLVDESYQDAYNRVLVFLYHKMKQIPIDPPNKYQLTPEEEKELMTSVLNFGHEHEFKDMALDLFHTDIGTLSTEIHDFEYNDPNRPRSTEPNKHKRILDKGTDHERCSLSLAGGFYRLISLMRHHGPQINYIADYSTHLCSPSSEGCIAVANSKESYDYLPEDGKSNSYIIVNPEYFPVVSPIPIHILYSRIPLVSFLIDAFLNKGILEIESKLKAKMEKDYPELFYINVKESNAEKMLVNARQKIQKTRNNLEKFWITNRNKSIRKKAFDNAKREVEVARARIEVIKAAAEMKENIAARNAAKAVAPAGAPAVAPASSSTPGLPGGPAVPPVVAPVAAALSQVNILLQKPRGPKGRRIPVVSPEAPGAAVAPGAPRRPSGPNPRRPVPAPQPGAPALQPGAPSLQPGPPALQPGPPALQPGAPALQPEPPAPSPRQPTAASTNNSPKNIKTRIGTIRQKFADAKAKINAFKARPKTKAKGGSRTRKLKSRR